MKAAPLFKALAALEAIRTAKADQVDQSLWMLAVEAYHPLKFELEGAGLTIPVEAEKEAA